MAIDAIWCSLQLSRLHYFNQISRIPITIWQTGICATLFKAAFFRERKANCVFICGCEKCIINYNNTLQPIAITQICCSLCRTLPIRLKWLLQLKIHSKSHSMLAMSKWRINIICFKHVNSPIDGGTRALRISPNRFMGVDAGNRIVYSN